MPLLILALVFIASISLAFRAQFVAKSATSSHRAEIMSGVYFVIALMAGLFLAGTIELSTFA